MPLGVYKRTVEHGKNISKAKRGHIVSEETKRKISETLKGHTLSDETKKKMSISRSGPKHFRWKGGICRSQGYIKILMPEHPFADSAGYILRSRLVMEKKLGRYLKYEEIVHHVNKNRDDDSPENLQLFPNISKHMSFHRSKKLISLDEQF